MKWGMSGKASEGLATRMRFLSRASPDFFERCAICVFMIKNEKKG